jgi:hypothetical protein
MLGPNRDIAGRGLPVPSKVTRRVEDAMGLFVCRGPAGRTRDAARVAPVARAKAITNTGRAAEMDARLNCLARGRILRILEHPGFSLP